MAHTTTPVEAIKAPTTGALPGFEATCSCGLVMRNTVRTNVELDVRQHGDWHKSQKGR